MTNLIAEINASNYGSHIVKAFTNLIKAIDTLNTHLLNPSNRRFMRISDGKGGFIEDYEGLCGILKFFQPGGATSPQETLSWQGLVAANEETLCLIDNVNTAKDLLRLTIKASKPFMPKLFEKCVRDILAKAGFGLVKLKPAYRRIYYSKHHIERASWSKAKDSSHKIITIKDAKAALSKAGQGTHIELQLAKLLLLKPTEKLVIVRESKPHWIVNFSYKKKDKVIRDTINTSLPLFYFHNIFDEDPQIYYAKKNVRKVKCRADKKIEDTPYLPSISAFRYKTSSV